MERNTYVIRRSWTCERPAGLLVREAESSSTLRQLTWRRGKNTHTCFAKHGDPVSGMGIKQNDEVTDAGRDIQMKGDTGLRPLRSSSENPSNSQIDASLERTEKWASWKIRLLRRGSDRSDPCS